MAIHPRQQTINIIIANKSKVPSVIVRNKYKTGVNRVISAIKMEMIMSNFLNGFVSLILNITSDEIRMSSSGIMMNMILYVISASDTFKGLN